MLGVSGAVQRVGDLLATDDGTKELLLLEATDSSVLLLHTD